MLKNTILILILGIFICSCGPSENGDNIATPKKPNILVILADDLGYGEVGVYGQKIIKTPNIDGLAKTGLLFRQHYAGSPVCAPSRSVLLTGLHSGHTPIRGNDEWGHRGDVWNYNMAVKDPQLEGQRPLPDSSITIAELLKSAGYHTSLIGKWGLGAPGSEGTPNKQGFDYFFGYNCQRQAHNLYPPHLWENDNKVLLENEVVAPGTKLSKDADILDEKSYQLFSQEDYAPQVMQERALTFLKDHHTNQSDQPFFMYYASPIPHVPLQVPKKYVDQYRPVIGDESPYLGQNGYFPHRYPKAAYAGMITYLDDQIGELMATLKQQGQLENTIIIFTSDNGPTYAGGADAIYFNSAAPFKNERGRTKGYTYEGGIRVPMIVSWPDKIKADRSTDHISSFYDLMPTLCEIAGVEIPNYIDGISFLPTLVDQQSQKEHEFLYWEFPSYQGQQAVRLGKWKGIRKDIFKGNINIELYDLNNDISEQNNIADMNPEVVEQIERIMVSQHQPSPVERFQLKPVEN